MAVYPLVKIGSQNTRVCEPNNSTAWRISTLAEYTYLLYSSGSIQQLEELHRHLEKRLSRLEVDPSARSNTQLCANRGCTRNRGTASLKDEVDMGLDSSVRTHDWRIVTLINSLAWWMDKNH